MILIIMMLMISWFMSKTPRDQIISALVFLLSPLKIVRFPIETMALRIELVLRNIDDVRMMLLEKKDRMNKNIRSVTEIGESVSGLYFDIVETIDSKALEVITVDLQKQPSAKQWLLPILIFIALVLFQNYL